MSARTPARWRVTACTTLPRWRPEKLESPWAGGSDIAMNSAGVALMSNDLRRLPFLVNLSRETTNVIWQNLIFGVTFILVAEVAIVYKFVGPMMAAFLHTLSSAIVVFNSARMVRFGEHLEAHKPAVARRAGWRRSSGRVGYSRFR